MWLFSPESPNLSSFPLSQGTYLVIMHLMLPYVNPVYDIIYTISHPLPGPLPLSRPQPLSSLSVTFQNVAVAENVISRKGEEIG